MLPEPRGGARAGARRQTDAAADARFEAGWGEQGGTVIEGTSRVATCGHCREPLGDRADGGLRRCDNCGFVYPEPGATWDDPIHRDHELLPGDRYRLIKPLRTWGTGRVYLARHLLLDEPCVVKVLSPADPGFCDTACRRFMEEAKAGFRIKHSNVARVLDCGLSDGQWYFVMEYVEGANLADVLHGCGRLPWAQVARIGVQATRGLAAIHAADLLHRDVKPSNLLLGTDGSVKIADLGLVQIVGMREATGTGGLIGPGTPKYMAPEQRTGGDDVDARADLYSLGATLYHLLVGHPPCRGDGPLAYLAGGDEHAAIEWPRDVTPRVPHWLCNVVDRCLAGQPDQRYGSAEELAAELDERMGPGPSDAPATGVHPGTPRAIVVLPFENLSRDAADDWIGHAMADEIHHALHSAGRVQTIDRHGVLHLLGRAYVEHGGVPTDAQVLEASGRLGAGIVIRGTFQHVDDRTKVTVLRFDGDDPGGRAMVRVVEASDDVFRLQAVVAERVLGALGLPARRSEAKEERPRLGREARKLYTSAHRAFAAGQYEQAVSHCRAGLEKAPASVELLSLMGVTLARLAAYDEAVECHRRLEKIAREGRDPHRLVESTGNLGVIYYYKGENAPAYELLQRAGEMAADLNLLPLLARTCNNIGFVLTRMERLVEADAAFEESIRIKLQLGATAALVSPYNGRGRIALNSGRYHDALGFYRQALRWAEELNDRVNIGICRMNIGRCFLHTQQFEHAESYLSQAVACLSSTQFWNGIAMAYEQLAELCLTRGRPDDAFEYIEKCVDLARRHDNRFLEASAWEQKARAYELADRKDEAIECMRKSFHLQQGRSGGVAWRPPRRSTVEPADPSN